MSSQRNPQNPICNIMNKAKPENPSCTVREKTAVPDDIESVTVSCSTTKVYPEAKCSFEQRTNGVTFVAINKTPTYNHTKHTGKTVYYRSECSVDVSVAELGEGTHSFRVFIYPDVTNGRNLVTATTASTTVSLTIPKVSYTCSPEMMQGYFDEKSATCTCSLTSDGYPKGQAQWYKGNQTGPGLSGGVLDLVFDKSNYVQNYTCKGVSAIGESSASTLTAKFAYAPVVTFTHNSASSEFNEGDTPTFTCTAQGNPAPSLTLTRKRTNQQLARFRENLKTTELTHTPEPLDCLDTDVYVCAGQNVQGITTQEIFVPVKCPMQLTANISQPKTVETSLGETAELDLEIYGYPAPHQLTLMRTTDNTNLTGSARHLIEYSPGQAPFGFVNVTISDVIEADFSSYIIIADNGESNDNGIKMLMYRFYFGERTAERRKGKDNIIIVVVVVLAVLTGLVIVAILAILVLRFRGRRQMQVLEPAHVVKYSRILTELAKSHREMTSQASEQEGMGLKCQSQLQVSQPQQTNGYEEYVNDPTNKLDGAAQLCDEEGMGLKDHKQAQMMQSKQTNEYEKYDPYATCKPEGATAKLFEEKGKKPKDARQKQVSQPQQTNEYEEYIDGPTNKPEEAVHMSEEEGMGLKDLAQFQAPLPDQKNIYEEFSPDWAIGYEIPAQLLVERGTRPENDTLQQPYANYLSLQQESNETKHGSYTNINFHNRDEKCVYMNTAGQE
ncbi:neural cell adhesion molecule 1 [Plakobranchus ocellatus]|uniref:Neural cell adhesion molecule 1 n=1 Tax=Plakobranchus ocellatus TaxID=259542 RepID=A0AAV4C7R7_9GAST|nr:neural cell adhesion molecule 1 [Plakobranchus ocellatus]